MRLDRNINPDGQGKYALINIRKLREISAARADIRLAIRVLSAAGLVHYGDEGEGEQFFVMKYKDLFTAPALRAYAQAAKMVAAKHDAPVGLSEYALEIENEAREAEKSGNRIPD